MVFIANQIGLSDSSAYIYMYNGTTGVSFSFTTAYQQMASLGVNFILAAKSKNFAMTTDGQLKYTGLKPRTFYFDANLQTTSASYALQLYKNGSPISGSEMYIPAASGANILKFPVSMVTNDYVSVYAKASAGATTTIFQVILSASIANGS